MSTPIQSANSKQYSEELIIDVITVMVSFCSTR